MRKNNKMKDFEVEYEEWWDLATLTLGSWPRQGLARVRAKREARESYLMLPGVLENVRE